MRGLFGAGLLSIILSQVSWAGSIIFGPQTFVTATTKNTIVNFTAPTPGGMYWLRVKNGQFVQVPGAQPGVVQGQNLVTGGSIKINGSSVAGNSDFKQSPGFQKEVTLAANNVMEVNLSGSSQSSITVEIREADSNTTVSNKAGDLNGWNTGDQIVLGWARDDRVAEYVVYRSTSMKGPWQEINRLTAEAFNTSRAAVDVTPDASLMDLCYKVDGFNSTGKVTRRYDPVCVPKFRTPQGQSSIFRRPSSIQDVHQHSRVQKAPAVQLASFIALVGLLAAAPTPADELCVSDSEFTNASAMTLDQIRDFLAARGSFLQGVISDVDGVQIDPAAIIDNIAQLTQINPQVLLTTLQKEQRAISRTTVPPSSILAWITGFGTPSTVRDQIEQAAVAYRRDYDRLTSGLPTVSGWQPGVTKNTQDPIPVTPTSNATAILYTYTPWAGQALGGRTGIGGNGLFCQVWDMFGFRPAGPLVLNTSDPTTLVCPDGAVNFSASGGRPPYSWSTTKGVITSSSSSTATLRPPTNNPSVSGTAYYSVRGTEITNGIIFKALLHVCNGLAASVCQGNHFKQNSCTLEPWDFENVCGFSGPFDCQSFPLCHGDLKFCDQRTPQMVSAGCVPCDLAMSGDVTVTLQDSAGASVSTSVPVTTQAEQQ